VGPWGISRPFFLRFDPRFDKPPLGWTRFDVQGLTSSLLLAGAVYIYTDRRAFSQGPYMA